MVNRPGRGWSRLGLVVLLERPLALLQQHFWTFLLNILRDNEIKR